jgi:hypothetical protein
MSLDASRTSSEDAFDFNFTKSASNVISTTAQYELDKAKLKVKIVQVLNSDTCPNSSRLLSSSLRGDQTDRTLGNYQELGKISSYCTHTNTTTRMASHFQISIYYLCNADVTAVCVTENVHGT